MLAFSTRIGHDGSREMPEFNRDALQESCSGCGIAVEVANAEPLARVTFSGSGKKFQVQRAFGHFLLIETRVGGIGAHEGGLIHRDIKPANILHGDFGQQ